MTKPVVPETRITAHSTALIAQDTDLRGEITIGSGCIIHPRATIIAALGPIVIGPDCIIEETAVITNRSKDILRIGSNNHFMVGSRVEARSVGDWNLFKPKCKIGSDVKVGSHCTFGACTTTIVDHLDDEDTDEEPLEKGKEGKEGGKEKKEVEVIEDYTVVWGSMDQRREWDKNGSKVEQDLWKEKLEYLRGMMPKYNRMRVI